MSGAFRLGKIFGIEIRIHYSWFIIFLLVVFSLVWPDWSQPVSWVIGIITSLLFFASVLAHELAHSLVGRANGVTIKRITLFIFGGMAQMSGEARKASAEFKMAAAGPACSLIIGGISGLIWFLTRNLYDPVAIIFLYLALANGSLAVFNMIPGFPLDGGRVFRSILWRTTGNYGRSTRIAAWVGRIIAYAFIIGGILIALFEPWDLIWFNGLWLAFIGWFLDNAAAMSYRQVQQREALQGLNASQIMTSSYAVVPPGITIDQLVQEYIVSRAYRLFLVVEEDKFRGVITPQNIKSIPQSKWALTQVDKIMLPAERLKIARPDQDALSVAEQLGGNDTGPIPVVSEGKVMGLITLENLVRLLRTRAELGIKNTSGAGRQE